MSRPPSRPFHSECSQPFCGDPFDPTTSVLGLQSAVRVGRRIGLARTDQPFGLPELFFTDSQNRDFRLDEESPLFKAGIGAKDFALLESPWPVQPEERRSITAVEERLTQTYGQR